MAEHSSTSHPAQRRYPPELRERAVRLVREVATEQGERHGAITRVAKSLGIGPESLRKWVAQAEIDQGARAGLTTAERARIKELERENRELRRANEILKSAFFGFSTADRRGDPVHRRAPPLVRGRADLPPAGDRPLLLLRREAAAAG